MQAFKALPVLLLLLFCFLLRNTEANDSKDAKKLGKPREKRAFMAAMGFLGNVLSWSATFQGVVCSFVSCIESDTTARLEQIQKDLNIIKADVKSIKDDVAEIWDVAAKKWYFKTIAFVGDERNHVINDVKSEDHSTRAQDRQNRFVNMVLGGEGQDQFVEQALAQIPKLVVEEGLVTHYHGVQIKAGKSPTEAAKLTWTFMRKVFRAQEDGYVSMIMAAAMRYKNDEKSFISTIKDICKWWPKAKDTDYNDLCNQFGRDEYTKDRRKWQQDFLLSIRDFSLFPGRLVKTDCDHFADSDSLIYSNGHLYAAQKETKKIVIINPGTLEVVKSINIPGDQCGGSCHPTGISIYAPEKIVALSAKSSGGDSKVMLFKINGNLDDLSGISLERYLTLPRFDKVNNKNADIVGVALCGTRLAFADYNGKITYYEMPGRLAYGYNDGKPDPIKYGEGAKSWALYKLYNSYRDRQYYFTCSADGKYFVIERTQSDQGVGAVPINTGRSHSRVSKILDQAEVKVMKSNEWSEQIKKDGHVRMFRLKGISMDSKKNILYSSETGNLGNTIPGVYQKRGDGRQFILREWNRGTEVTMYSMAVDDKGGLYSLEKIGAGKKCLYKFDYEIDLEDTNFE